VGAGWGEAEGDAVDVDSTDDGAVDVTGGVDTDGELDDD
jgi:hypothetical protein